MHKNVVGFGPSLVDIGAKLPQKEYEECCDILDVRPGDWSRIERPEQADQLLRAISGAAIRETFSLENLHANPNITVTPGSSILGMLAAMPPDIRSSASFVSALATQRDTIEPMSSFFTKAVEATGITHHYQEVKGYNPLGFVLSSESDPDKVLGMYPGVATKLEGYDLASLRPDLVVLDTYELLEGKMAEYLDSVIRSGEFRIALSLGNHTILNGETGDKIREYIATGKIGILCGNSIEYQTLFPELDSKLATKEGFRSHPIREYVPFALMTMGEDGAIASWEKQVVALNAPPIDPSEIVNTSGAGDVTAGVFYSGVLTGKDPEETLQRAAYSAGLVLRNPGSMVLAENAVSPVV
jgi:sugar/nucleoside kinase (ribokinase family)